MKARAVLASLGGAVLAACGGGGTTSVEQAFDMSALDVNREAQLVGAMFAAQGYIVVAPNYTGYAGSTLDYHPDLNAEAQAADMIDAWRAARRGFAQIGVAASARLSIFDGAAPGVDPAQGSFLPDR